MDNKKLTIATYAVLAVVLVIAVLLGFTKCDESSDTVADETIVVPETTLVDSSVVETEEVTVGTTEAETAEPETVVTETEPVTEETTTETPVTTTETTTEETTTSETTVGTTAPVNTTNPEYDPSQFISGNLTPEEEEKFKNISKVCPNCKGVWDEHSYWFMSDTNCPECGVLVATLDCHHCGS